MSIKFSKTMNCCRPKWELSDKMEQMEVIPDVIDKKPNTVLNVTYERTVKVCEGNELTPTTVKDKPVVYWDAEEDTFYLLLMTDPDAPCREEPEFREWHHWLVGNIPGNNVQMGETLSEYIGAAPPENTGLHRYVFLLYKQPDKLSFDEEKLSNRSGDGRGNFSTRDFVEKYSLGDPVAGNFFQAKWDVYVPIVYRQLEGGDETDEEIEV